MTQKDTNEKERSSLKRHGSKKSDKKKAIHKVHGKKRTSKPKETIPKTKKTIEKKRDSSPFYQKVFGSLGAILILFALYNFFQIASLNGILADKIAAAEEAARPADIQLAVLTTDCEDCYDIQAVADSIASSSGVKVTAKKEYDYTSPEGKALIKKYQIEKLPSLVVTGELEKASSLKFKLKNIGEEKEDAYVVTKLEPPYIDVSSGDVRGRVKLTYLKSGNCEECRDLTPMIDQFKKSGVDIVSEEDVTLETNKGRELAQQYGIEKVPVLIFDKEAEVYPNIAQIWNQMGSIEDDGSYVMRQISAPYYSVDERAVKGLINLIMLQDESCDGCYEPEQFHKPILVRMGVALDAEEKIDAASIRGKQLIEKYAIKKLPTILLSGDTEEYPTLLQAWKPVGTVEDDGMMVFRSVEVARQPYRDLTSGEIVDPSQQQTAKSKA